ncbi:uracil-DNA glycosylase [candidate division KSB1 bacterium]|nr:uracil-DNA glycosylase [candidate division KSB1 bacterium]
MNDHNRTAGNLIADIFNYLEYQKDLYGDDVFVAEKSSEKVIHEPQTKPQRLNALYLEVKNCQQCGLCNSRRNVVFGAGNPDADIMLIGEAPGAEEDLQGKPFVGAAGQLLTKILAAIQLKREEVFIANILKCRPPGNRDPLPEERKTCKKHLYKQIEIIQPKFILALGRVAGQVLLETEKSMQQLRGDVYDFQGAKLIVTYHPAALLRNQQWKRATWEDVQKLQKLYLNEKK